MVKTTHAEECIHFDPPLLLGETPLYRSSDSTLQLTDFKAGKIYICPVDPQTGAPNQERMQTITPSEPITVHYFRKNNNGFIASARNSIGFLDPETGVYTPKHTLITDTANYRLNDGCVDPRGRFWIGEIDYRSCSANELVLSSDEGRPTGKLWRFDPDGSLHCILPDGLVISNGIGFSPDYKTFYLNDSKRHVMYKFEFDCEKGEISKQSIVKDFRGSTIEPDGLVVDQDGNLWTALMGHGKVLKLSPNGESLEEVIVPTPDVTCPAWGDENNSTLYITTASFASKQGGHVYKLKTDVKGMSNFEFAG